jgi:hypothetical protein
MMIPGLVGPVVVESSFWSSRFTITAGGFPATRVGRNRYALPAAGSATVEATVSGGFFDAYPTLTINGVKHRTGPAVPVVLRVLAVLPIVLVFLGGFVGGLIGAIGWAANMAILRVVVSSPVKVLLMLAVLVVTVVAWVEVAAAISVAVNS